MLPILRPRISAGIVARDKITLCFSPQVERVLGVTNFCYSEFVLSFRREPTRARRNSG